MVNGTSLHSQKTRNPTFACSFPCNSELDWFNSSFDLLEKQRTNVTNKTVKSLGTCLKCLLQMINCTLTPEPRGHSVGRLQHLMAYYIHCSFGGKPAWLINS